MCTFALLKPTRWPHGWSGYSFTSCPGFWLWSVLNFSQISIRKLQFFYSFLKINSNYILKDWISEQSSLSIFLSIFINVKILRYFILQNKFFRIYEDSFGAKILRDDYTLIQNWMKSQSKLLGNSLYNGLIKWEGQMNSVIRWWNYKFISRLFKSLAS